jgi:hypothetical protein
LKGYSRRSKGPRVAIIEDLPKPVKNAWDALPSAVVSDNLMKAVGIKKIVHTSGKI